MKRWWMILAVALGCLGWTADLSAQPPYLPSSIGAARMPEPTPTGPSTSAAPMPPLIQGPVTALQAPPGPPPALSLREDAPGAFQACNWPPDTGCFFHLGVQALQRTHLGGPTFVSVGGFGNDPNNPAGLMAPGTAPAFATNDIHQPLHLGMESTLGCLWNGQKLEITVLGMFQSSNRLSLTQAGQLTVPFVNPPQGFTGDNGLWMEADQVEASYTSWFVSPEFNYHYASESLNETELILGFRFLSLREKLNVTTIDDITTPQNQNLVGAYKVQTRNNLIAPQAGFDWSYTFDNFQVLTLGIMGKGALGANFASVQNRLDRGDAFNGFDGRRNVVSFGTIWDANAYLELNFLQRMHLRAGYKVLWITGLAEAAQQIDYNLANTSGSANTSGTACYYGPSVEFEFLF